MNGIKHEYATFVKFNIASWIRKWLGHTCKRVLRSDTNALPIPGDCARRVYLHHGVPIAVYFD